MFTPINLAAARDGDWDVIVAGSSFAAMFFVMGLPETARVLVVEKGQLQTHDDQIANGFAQTEAFSSENSSGRPKDWVAHTMVGGNSNCWWGQVPRFHPSDFRLQTLYGQGRDWPFGYEELEPFYTRIEAAMQVAGGGREAIFPMSAPYPFPPHTGALTDRKLWDRPDWVPVATARANGGDRATCCANGVCQRCPIDAKFTILNAAGRFARDGVHLLTGAEARAVELAGPRATGLILRHGEQTVTIRARRVALATNAIFNAAILLRSGLDLPALGRFLHEQASDVVLADVPVDNYYGGTSITGHGYGRYDGPHRADVAAVLIENYNMPTALRFEPRKWTRRMRLKLIAEDLPQPANRVVLRGGEPHVLWQGHHPYAHAGIEAAVEALPGLLPWPVEGLTRQGFATTEAHIQGTHRIGADAGEGVVDDTLRVHGTEGLLALGAGAFPTCSPANPTLTLSALSLRAAERLA